MNLKELLTSLLIMSMVSSSLAQDKFAGIGTAVYQTREDLLVTPQPQVKEDVKLPVSHDPSAAFNVQESMSTAAELEDELVKMRLRYAPFLNDLAPKQPVTRKKWLLDNFQWREETTDDLSDFTSTLDGMGSWEEVNIPHYGPPLGRAVTYYFKDLQLTEEHFARGSLFIHFDGVDYKASIFLNGRYIGSHEGFFAPFEFDITKVAKKGTNKLLVKVENDFPTTGANDATGNHAVGDKIYAATGPGYDDPKEGWHHGPAGMGIYQGCYLETRSPLHINDIFVRPVLEDSIAELWIEINNYYQYPEDVKLRLSVFGQNFETAELKPLEFLPTTTFVPGVGDLDKPTDGRQTRLKMGYGVNYLKIPIRLEKFRKWELENPWLYQMQVELIDSENKLTDARSCQFGMRSFSMDTISNPKGRMFLNGNMVRLRGANTMGHLQQCVMQEDWDQLIDDILLAKIANMNYLRLTQRPVQPEIYEYMDRLGLMNQVDLPLFGSIRRNKFAEAVKQAEEMERLVRSHPSTIMVSYINERFPNAEGHPQRSFATLDEYNKLFVALDQAVLLSNPDRVIKAGDGDYDPPSPGLPDNHCYNLWYNGHGLGLGEMYKGFWQPVKPDWYYACGEFGAEGLDPVNVMRKYYPKSWLPETYEGRSTWNPGVISRAQSNRFHFMWYNTPGSVAEWVESSQDYQAWAIKFTTEAFRRDSRMMSFAVHLFIDAWPAGWMKTIMDVDRQPKKSFFAYRSALSPTIVTIRSDRRQYWSGEKTQFEIWLSNDLNESKLCTLKYQFLDDQGILLSNSVSAELPVNSSKFIGYLEYPTPIIDTRNTYTLQVALFDFNGNQIHQNQFDFDVFPDPDYESKSVYLIGDDPEILEIIANNHTINKTNMDKADAILVVDYELYLSKKRKVDQQVNRGATCLFLNLPAGIYDIGNSKVEAKSTEMGQYYFVSPETGHELVKAFKPNDFWLWYDDKTEMIEPILSQTFRANGWSA
ncbi:MAG: sugar-binding domain-containing protein, partial [Cyclobacteriaceae bacterium]